MPAECESFVFQTIVLTDAAAGLAGFKNQEKYLIVPLEPWLTHELLENGFLNVRSLESWREEKFESYDALYRFYESSACAITVEENDSSWRFLKQPFMQIIVPVCYAMDIMRKLREKEKPLDIQLRIVNPEYKPVFEEALKRLG